MNYLYYLSQWRLRRGMLWTIRWITSYNHPWFWEGNFLPGLVLFTSILSSKPHQTCTQHKPEKIARWELFSKTQWSGSTERMYRNIVNFLWRCVWLIDNTARNRFEVRRSSIEFMMNYINNLHLSYLLVQQQSVDITSGRRKHETDVWWEPG